MQSMFKHIDNASNEANEPLKRRFLNTRECKLDVEGLSNQAATAGQMELSPFLVVLVEDLVHHKMHSSPIFELIDGAEHQQHMQHKNNK